MSNVYKKGISLVVLVITVIVLIILTGVVLITSTGGDGVIDNTQETVDKNNKGVIIKDIDLKIQTLSVKKSSMGKYTLTMNEDIIPILETFGTFDNNILKLTTTETKKPIEIWLYEIMLIPLQEYSTITYNNDILTVETELMSNGYRVEYSTDGGTNWNEYVSNVTIGDESGICVRLTNEEGKVVSNMIKVTAGGNEVIDDIRPTVEITADTTDITNVDSITYTIIFSEPVEGFKTDDIQVSNGTKGTFTKVNETTYTIVVTNSVDCIQTVTVPEGCCTDEAGNSNEIKSKEININRTVPVVTISPNGTNGAKSISIKITAAAANGLKSDNEYKYCLTTSQTPPANDSSEWKTYISGNSMTIGTGSNGTYYIHTKVIYDIAGNDSGKVKSNPFIFDNTAPSIGTITGSGTTTNITLKSTVTDSVGVTGYAITTSTAIPSSWTGVTSTTSWSASVPTTNTGTTYLHVKDNVGNTSYKKVNICTGRTNSCSNYVTCQGGTVVTGRACYKCGHILETTSTSTLYHMVCSYCGSNSTSSDGTSARCACTGVVQRCVFCCSSYNPPEQIYNYCAHSRIGYHTVPCGHGYSSSHAYCSHSYSGVRHL